MTPRPNTTTFGNELINKPHRVKSSQRTDISDSTGFASPSMLILQNVFSSPVSSNFPDELVSPHSESADVKNEDSSRDAESTPRANLSFDETPAAATASTPEDIDYAAREEESLALARALMAEEAMAVSYAMSVDYLTHNRDQFSEEDLAALQAAMEEEDEDAAAAAEEVEEAEANGGLSYDFMLRLGERMGDVKSERWSRVAREKIELLDTFEYDPATTADKDANDCAVKCLVCQFPYEAKECLRCLPCGHTFHSECVDTWLMGKNWCPYCRQAIVEES
jgi:hypothetical protein